MRRARTRRPARFGLVALAAVLALTYLGFAKRLPWADDWEVKAVFSSATELHPGSPVRIAGVDVGKVKEVERGPGGTALVTLAVEERGRPLHRDATLKIRPRIFLEGNFFVDVRPGSPSAAELEEGDTIPLGQTAIPVQFDEILTTLRTSTRAQLKTAVRELAVALDGGGARALHDSTPDWEGAFEGGAVTMEALRGERPDDLPALVDAAGDLGAALAGRRERLQTLIVDLDRTVTALADRQAAVAASVRGLDALVRTAHPALGDVNAAFPTVRSFTGEVRPALREAPATLGLALPLLRQLHALLRPAEAPALVADLRPALRSLARLEPDLVTLLRGVRPVTECVRRNALPTLKAPVPDGHLATGAPAWQDLLHGMVGLASASQNFDGNGFAVRYHGGYGDQLVSTGRVPGFGRLYALAPEPVLGSRPKWPGPGRQPPFRPDVPCATQARPSLEAETAGAPAATRGRALPPSPRALRLARRAVARAAGAREEAR